MIISSNMRVLHCFIRVNNKFVCFYVLTTNRVIVGWNRRGEVVTEWRHDKSLFIHLYASQYVFLYIHIDYIFICIITTKGTIWVGYPSPRYFYWGQGQQISS